MNSTILSLLLSTLLASLAFSPLSVHAIGAAGDTEWPEGETLEVQLKISATLDKDGHPKVAGDLIVTNPTNAPLTIQKATNRLVLAFLIFDALGNPVAPKGVAKTDPAFDTMSLAPRTTYTHHFDELNFVTGSIEQSYSLTRGQLYRVIAVYRAAGPRGPGFTSHESKLQIPQ